MSALPRFNRIAMAFWLGVIPLIAGCGTNTETENKLQNGSVRDMDPSVTLSAVSHSPTLIDLGHITSEGAVGYLFWDETPNIEEWGTIEDSRILEIAHAGAKITKVSLSTFELDETGEVTAQRTIDCDEEVSSDSRCLLQSVGQAVLEVTVSVSEPGYATLQVMAEVSDGSDSTSEQTTWLL